MRYLDANAWVGQWPFALGAAHDCRSLAAELAEHGITRALVSPLGAVFAPEPGPANRLLLHESVGVAAVTPVPVINPALANWREELAACAADARVRAVRVLPNYHAFRLDGPAMRALAAELRGRGLKLIVQMRLIDERHEFHAMRLKGVPAAQLARLLERERGWPVLACGLLRPELRELAAKFPALLADTAFAEWHDTLAHLLERVPARQLVFGSGTPILMPGAGRAKIATARVPAAVRRAVAAGNLMRFAGR